MAYFGTKGYFIGKLKEKGVRRHPVEQRKLELYKTPIIRNLYVVYCSDDLQEKLAK